jgi:ribosomal protein S18 acetylase RimI-like enzyme
MYLKKKWNTMKVKSVTNKDIDKIYNLEKATFEENAFTRKLFLKLVKLHLLFLKLEKGLLNKKIIGFIIVIKDKKDRANLINFLIAKSYRNEGWGSFLLQHTLDRIKINYPKINKIILNVNVENSPAVHIYKKFHFKIADKIDNYYNNGDSAYVMKLDLKNNKNIDSSNKVL